MVIDSSAFVAILLGEPDAEALITSIVNDPVRLAGAATMLETGMVLLSRKGEPGVAALRAFSTRASLRIVPFEPEHVDVAIDAFRRYGRGRSPAGLNFGDCLSYALARTTGEPLLFKGDDFARTDVARAL